jgi:hypothetical protein
MSIIGNFLRFLRLRWIVRIRENSPIPTVRATFNDPIIKQPDQWRGRLGVRDLPAGVLADSLCSNMSNFASFSSDFDKRRISFKSTGWA